MQQFKKDQQIPLTQVTDPNTGQVYYSPQNVVYNDKNGNGPQYLRNVIVDQATTASYFSGSISNAISASYAANGGVTQIIAGSNITLSPTTGKGQVTISSTGGGGGTGNTATGSYGSFYDTTTQTNPVANTPRSMSFNTTDITNGVSISGSTNPFNTYIKTQNAGVYDIQFSAQLDKTDAGTDEVVIWLRKNGSDLTDTATTLTLSGNNDKQVAAWNWFVNSAANDYYQIIWYSADTDLRLFAETAGGGHPGIPSVILTVNRVDQFLSNTGSFSGSFTGTFTGSFSGSGTITSASYAVQAGNSNTINVNAFSSPVESYLLMSNVVATTGVAIGGDSDLRYNSSTNVLTVPNVSATTLTGSLLGTASYAAQATSAFTASYVLTAQTASYVLNAVSSSYALSASFALSSSRAVSASFALSSSRAVSASFTTLAQTANTASYVLTAQTASYVQTAQTASYVLNAVSASYALNSTNATNATNATNVAVTDTTTGTGPYYVMFADGTTGNRAVRVDSNSLTFNATTNTLTVTSSYTNQATSAFTASYVLTAQTASYVLNAVSASFASTASYVNPLVQNVIITGSLITSASNGNGINTSNTTLNSGILPTVDWGNRQLYDTNNYVIDWGQSFLISSISSSVTVQWGVGYLKSLSTSMSIDWNSRYAFDANNISSIDWNNRDLLDSSPARSVNWQDRELYDRLGVSSVNWDNRILNDSTGATKLRWDSTGVQVTGSLIVSGSSTFTNIGPAIFSGSITQNASTALFGGIVGIGTTTPAYKLDVSGSINTNTGLTVTGSLLISGSATIGSSSPSTENTLTLGPPPGGGTGEGGQLGLQSTGGSYTSASFIDNWQNQFRILRGTNASSNAGLMYMDLQNGNTNFIGAVTASGGYSNLPNDYLYATRATSNQTVGSAWANTDIIFNNVVVSKGISFNTSTGVASLTGGKVYRVTARLAWQAAATYNLQFSCYTSANTQIGPTVEIIQSTNGTNNISDGTLEFIYAPSSNTDIKIRCTNNNTALSGEQIRYDLNTQFIIQQIA